MAHTRARRTLLRHPFAAGARRARGAVRRPVQHARALLDYAAPRHGARIRRAAAAAAAAWRGSCRARRSTTLRSRGG
eukprot:7036814-Prymnesium_polylepis.1